jgi:predicted O-methyltransferase YrrM
MPPDLKKLSEIEGQITSDEASELARLASEVQPNQDIVEIGSYRGRSTCALAVGSIRGHGNRVYAVDPHVEFVGPKGGHYGPADQAVLYENLSRMRLGEIVAIVSLPSQSAARAWPGESIGLLWIDGDHNYPAVLADVDAGYPHVVHGGIIAFHDVDMSDVSRVIDHSIQQGKMSAVGMIDGMRWFKKTLH